jgi:hypothetical protein
MALPRLSTPPRAALHSARSRPRSPSHHVRLRDLTAWLALGLSIAAVMFVVARQTGGTPPASLTPATTLDAPGAAPGAHASITSGSAAKDRPRTATEKRPRAGAATKARSVSRVLTTPTTLVRSSGASVPPSTSPDIAPVSEQWAGVLAYPDDVATSYSFTTTGGTVVVRTTLANGSRRLSSSLQCAGSATVRTSHAAATTMTAAAGSCTYDLQFVESAFEPGAHAAYQITARYPALVPAS